MEKGERKIVGGVIVGLTASDLPKEEPTQTVSEEPKPAPKKPKK